MRAIADEVEAQVAAAGGPRPVRVEGHDDLTWVLMDYGDFVVHVFLEETRRYYDLERLWADVRPRGLARIQLPPRPRLTHGSGFGAAGTAC